MQFAILHAPNYDVIRKQSYYEQMCALPYEGQIALLSQHYSGLPVSYFVELVRRGHKVVLCSVTNETLQRRWAIEHQVEYTENTNRLAQAWNLLPLVKKKSYYKWSVQTLIEQIRDNRPDLILNFNTLAIRGDLLMKLKRLSGAKLIGFQNSPSFPKERIDPYDLIVSDNPLISEQFNAKGVGTTKFKLCFDSSIQQFNCNDARVYDVAFVGNVSAGTFENRLEWLDYLSRNCANLKIWTAGGKRADFPDTLNSKIQGSVWGREMLNVLGSSKIVINKHVDAQPFAHNLRLYEATGCGAMLLTDALPGIEDIFEVGKEVVTYDSKEDCLEKIDYYLDNEDERLRIASNGQQATLTRHTVSNRVDELFEIISRSPGVAR